MISIGSIPMIDPHACWYNADILENDFGLHYTRDNCYFFLLRYFFDLHLGLEGY
jgi:hypothetical protein